MHLSDGPAVEVVITHLQPTVIEEAVKDGFFDPPRAETALRLAANVCAYNAKVSYLLSVLSSTTPSAELVLRAVEEIEAVRREIIVGARLMAKLQ